MFREDIGECIGRARSIVERLEGLKNNKSGLKVCWGIESVSINLDELSESIGIMEEEPTP